ncbi:tetratricopeptide repeat protein [Salidesulfovibrio brasiliensis]|uniref:tetratricopeptide repeat protein n=1 Tax=Salidesulfovibrio brasiliensis TaxID=221711 RepID=UPI000A58F7F2|nr:tetratricopeptide repeat protein [Salidesulfovibrio brasiliensis]
MREEILYAVADIAMQMHKDDPKGFFDPINDAYLKALNANLESDRVPHALLNLGLVNLKAGNIPEAKAYFNILRNKYPDDQNIPAISYYWGDYYFKQGDYREAADQFQYMIQKYPEHELVKSAAYMLAKSLEKTGYDEQAFQVTDYIDKRWPDFYMQEPEFLLLAGGIEERVGKYAPAKDHYFTYYNLNPEAEKADIALAKIGDLYLKLDQLKPAKEIYQKAAEDYPDEEGGLISKMRLAEEGIYDDPTLVQMGGVFDRPYNLQPVNIYTDIVEKHPESPLAPVAQLKLAMWYAFHDKYAEALAASQDFLDLFPDSKLANRARELGDSVFVRALPGLIQEENYKRVVRYWEDYDFIGEEETKVDDDAKLMVATAYWKLGQPAEALALLQPYLDKQIPGVSDKALDLAVNVYLGEYNWDAINELVKHAEANWDIDPKQLRQLNYARAMSLQNLGDETKAVPLWAELAKNPEVDPSFRGYAMYYLAKNAMKKQDLRRVFLYSQEALALLLQNDGDPEKIKDAVLMSINSTERSGRYEQALRWAREYDKYIGPDHPEWAPTRLKLARIYRKAGAMEEWKSLLQDIVDKKPQSLQADLARSELETYQLEQRAQEYAPSPQ